MHRRLGERAREWPHKLLVLHGKGGQHDVLHGARQLAHQRHALPATQAHLNSVRLWSLKYRMIVEQRKPWSLTCNKWDKETATCSGMYAPGGRDGRMNPDTAGRQPDSDHAHIGARAAC